MTTHARMLIGISRINGLTPSTTLVSGVR